jgi:hypothetical protein
METKAVAVAVVVVEQCLLYLFFSIIYCHRTLQQLQFM